MNEYLDRVLHPTVQRVGNSRAAVEVIHKGYYVLNPVPTVAYIVESGSTDNILKLTSHGFRRGDLIRFAATVNPIQEFEIIVDDIIDTDNVKLAGYLSASLTAGDTFFALRAISERFDNTGATLASIATPAVSYNRKSGGITTQTSVLEDLDIPANSRAMPVVLHGVDAASITITSNDLNIASSHVNDSIRLGDGTTLTGVTANNELKVKDTDAQTNFGLIADAAASSDTGSFSLMAFIKRGMQNWTSLLAKIPTLTLVGSALKVDGSAVTQPVSGTVTANAGTNLNTSALALETTQVANGVLIGPVLETAPASDTASSGLNGRLQRIAQRITSLIALLPAALGQGTMAQSLRVVLASDQSTIVVSATATTNLDTNLGAKADAVASTDTGTFSLISLIKKVNQSLTALIAQLPATLGIKTSALSLSVAPSSDGVFTIKPKALTNSYAEFLTLTTVQTFSAPANAIGGKIMASDQNTDNVNYKQNATATTTSGMQLQAGRSEDFTGGNDVTVVSKSGTQAVMIQWTIQA